MFWLLRKWSTKDLEFGITHLTVLGLRGSLLLHKDEWFKFSGIVIGDIKPTFWSQQHCFDLNSLWSVVTEGHNSLTIRN